jgi:ubiquinone/menaquinone biosynthesis C-methylase UbiE
MASNPRIVLFHRLAAEWDSLPVPPDVGERLARVVSLGQLPRGGVALDVGAGTGVLVPVLLEQQPYAVISVDFAPGMIARLRHKYMGYRRVVPLCADITRPPLAENRFDTVYAHAVFPHFSDRPAALRELWRVTRPGGRLVISHIVGREEVNRKHRDHPVLYGDLLPSAVEVCAMLAQVGWRVLFSEDVSDFYLVVARKPQLPDHV